VGFPCEIENEGCCEPQQPIVVCRAVGPLRHLTWVVANEGGDEFCECYEDEQAGRTMVACAVPGFVGITAARRVRPRAPRLRQLIVG
jgi:hypothetical protein